MTNVNEAASARTPLGSALKVGVDNISYSQEITFDLYVQMILPLDGYVFWIKSTILATPPTTPPAQIKVMGSLHYVTDVKQEESSSVAVNEVIFTSEAAVQDFNALAPNMLYIASFDNIRFAFSHRRSWYQQSDLWHYVGNAIYSTMDSQIIDDPAKIPDPNNVIVSNSLPAWLAINTRTIPWLPYWDGSPPPFQLFPSFLNPLNKPPLYGSVHIVPDETVAAQSVAYLDSTYSRWQLARDHVEVCLYGCDNLTASNFLDMMIDYFNTEAPMGLMNMPILRDGKKIQPELLILAEEKTIVFDVSYNQSAMRNFARQLILNAIISIEPQDI